MRALLVVALLGACAKPDPYVCAIDSDCGSGAFCETDGNCSIADATCPSGRRYSDIGGGAVAGLCVDGSMSLDESALCNVTAARPSGTVPDTCAKTICDVDPTCCATSWDQQCARMAEARCDLDCAPEIVAAGGYRLAAAFNLDTPTTKLWSEYHSSWNQVPAWGDIDGDGLPDLAVGREANSDGPGLKIYQNTGLANGTLELTAVSIGGDPIDTVGQLTWRDFDGDDLDLLAAGKGIYLVVTDNNTFTSHMLTTTNAEVDATWASATPTPPWRIAARDGMTGSVVTYDLSDTYGLSSPTSLGLSQGGVTWCQIGGTGARDIVAGGRIFIANATGYAAATDASASGYASTCADLDDDDKLDLVIADYSAMHIVMNRNGGVTSTPIDFAIIGAHFGIADFDDDGRVDILVSSAQASDDVQEIPLRLLENRTNGFMLRPILPDWNTPMLDSSGLDIGRMPRE